jgi:hypothetical protein
MEYIDIFVLSDLIAQWVWFGLWCLQFFVFLAIIFCPLYFPWNYDFELSLCVSYSDFYIVAVSFIGGGNRSNRRKPPTCHKTLTNLIT